MISDSKSSDLKRPTFIRLLQQLPANEKGLVYSCEAYSGLHASKMCVSNLVDASFYHIELNQCHGVLQRCIHILQGTVSLADMVKVLR